VKLVQLWVDKLILEYADKRKQLAAYRDLLDRDDIQNREELRIVNGMISDLNFGMQWMRTGRCPSGYRGAESGDAYRYADLMEDMDLLQLMVPEEEPEAEIDPERKKILVHILLKMSVRERQCYLLHTAKGLSYTEIGDRMGINRFTVRTFIKRAKSKVELGIK
jgi:RNA polymerase sigma factor (sigma-70 family)